MKMKIVMVDPSILFGPLILLDGLVLHIFFLWVMGGVGESLWLVLPTGQPFFVSVLCFAFLLQNWTV